MNAFVLSALSNRRMDGKARLIKNVWGKLETKVELRSGRGKQHGGIRDVLADRLTQPFASWRSFWDAETNSNRLRVYRMETREI